MLTRTLRKSMQRREGQALVLGAITVLILSIAVITTVNFGHNIHERVRLQNTADAAAYSMAAMEARAFNFYAFSNRTQVSQYVSAMVLQSVLSFIYFLEAFLVDIFGVLKSLDRCAGNRSTFWTVACPILENLPYVGPVVKAVNNIIDVYRKFVKNGYVDLLKKVDPDKFVGPAIFHMRLFNMGMSAMASATMAGTLSHVQGVSSDVITDNDPNVDLGPLSAAVGAMNSCIFDRSHMKAAGVAPFVAPEPQNPIRHEALKDTERDAIPKRAMGNIVNASRFGCDNDGFSVCGPGWVTSRKLSELFPIPGQLGVVKELFEAAEDSALNPIKKWGQTKMLSHNNGYKFARGRDNTTNRDGKDNNYIRDWDDTPSGPIGVLAQGDNMGSDDLYKISFGPAEFGFPLASVKNPFACDKDEDPKHCWGDPRVGKDETNRNKLPFRRMTKTSIFALNDDDSSGYSPARTGGIHFRLVHDDGGLFPPQATNGDRPQGGFGNGDRDIGISKVNRELIDIIGFSIDIDMYVANVRGVQDGNHRWGGITRFPHFEPGQYSNACPLGGSANESTAAADRKTEFNQPSSWVAINKKPEELLNPKPDTTGATRNNPALLNSEKTLNFAFSQPTKLQLDNARKEFLGFKGMRTVSRAQTYYHRPGNWAEQPNFFNPYWRPRLASVWQGRYSVPLINDVVNLLPGPVKQFPQKIITH